MPGLRPAPARAHLRSDVTMQPTILDLDILPEPGFAPGAPAARLPGSGDADGRNVDAPDILGAALGTRGRRVYIETYGCQMNVADSEVVASVLASEGYGFTTDAAEADVVLLNTCAIRENAEQKVRRRLAELRHEKRHVRRGAMQIGVLGCMAERLRARLLDEEKLVDLVVGPDAYREIGALLRQSEDTGQAAVNVLLSREETYAEIAPVRYDTNGVTAFVSIMRGCDNMCAFCVVPFTRGRERSRPSASILDEVRALVDTGYKEVTVLGQNVNSYRSDENGAAVDFAELLYRISLVSDELRIRYSTSHPKDCSDALLHVHRERPGVCNFIHLPVQHGSSEVLDRMRRTYTREQYLALIDRARQIVPGVAFSTDLIAGFCGETEAEHAQTLTLMAAVRYDSAFMFAYSERPQTYAARKLADDVPEALKKRRLGEIIAVQNRHSLVSNERDVATVQTVLAEGPSKRSAERLVGRTDTNKAVVFDREGYAPGDYVRVRIDGCTSATLLGTALGRTTLAGM